MEHQQTGSKAYLFSIVMVAVLGGLLFGYDTAVISGAEKGLQAFCLVYLRNERQLEIIKKILKGGSCYGKSTF